MKVRVCQCWDDGVSTDVRLVQILRKHHAKATFNLCPGFMQKFRVESTWLPIQNCKWSNGGFQPGHVGLSELVNVYGDFQVATHCWNHETPVDMDKFIASAVRTKKFLEETFQRECPGFAWPNGADTPEAAAALKKEGFLYGRTTRNTKDVLACPDPMRLDTSCHHSCNNFWDLYQEAKATTGVFYFWGHTYELFEYDPLWNRLEAKIAAISADPDAEWVDVADLFR